MEADKIFLCIVFLCLTVLIVCGTAYGIAELTARTETTKVIIACDFACPEDNDHCLIECLKAISPSPCTLNP